MCVCFMPFEVQSFREAGLFVVGFACVLGLQGCRRYWDTSLPLDYRD